jgi:formylglycine-generating enzyme required for sulfatase activity
VRALAALSVLLAAGCSCGTSHVPSTDAATDETDAGLPVVAPGAADCEDVETTAGRDCVPEGWFALTRWTQGRSPSRPARDEPRPTPVYLDAFELDREEVTNAEYSAFVATGEVAAPPADCGGTQTYSIGADMLIPHTSGWDSGAPPADRLDHPVLCVSRVEARAYCAWVGGRLPTLAELFKVSRGPWPDLRRYPWGDAPPDDRVDWVSVRPEGWPDEWAAIAREWETDRAMTSVVRSAERGRGYYGTLGLSGNVSEIVSDCPDDASSVAADAPYGALDVPWLIRPQTPDATRCARGIVVVGANWMSDSLDDLVPSVSAFLFRGAGRALPPQPTDVPAEVVFGDSRSDLPVGEDDGARSWQIGFRCAYDLGA